MAETVPKRLAGIITGIILSIGRIVGESAALLFTAGSGYLLPKLGKYGEGLFQKLRQPGGTLTIQLYLSMEKGEYEEAFGIALVLLALVFGINRLTKYLAHKLDVNK